MIPLLIISNNEKLISDYINKIRKDSFYSVFTPSSKEYSIEDIRNLIKETKVFHPKKRIYFLADFHLSSIPAQNSFLKLLEEPPTNVQFNLSTDNKNNLLPTVVSRTKIVKLKDSRTVSTDKIIQNYISELVENNNLRILNESDFSLLKREDVLILFNQIIAFFRKRLDSDKKSAGVIKETLRLKSLFENNNLNPQLTIDQLLIFIWKQYNIKLKS